VKTSSPFALLFAVVFSFAVAAWGTLRADDPLPEPPVAAEPATTEQITEWLQNLDSDAFAEREAATTGLVRAGAPAVAAIARTAEESFDLEVPTRCVNILGKMLRGDDAEASRAARTALEGLAESDRKFVANRATESLKGPAEPAPVNPLGRNRAMRISQTTVNGVRTTEVEADGKKIKVTDTNGKEIAMKVTETVAGREVTKEYAGRDLADLKQKHPEGARLYEEYVEGNANPFGGFRGIQRIRIAPGGRIRIGPGGAVPVLPNGPNVRPFKMPFVPREQVDGAIEKLEKSLESIEALEKRAELPKESLRELREQIEAARRQLDEAG
jgi:hypothetical protein